MPKEIDAKVRERCTRLVLDHLAEYPSLTAACQTVARREGVGYESVRRWVLCRRRHKTHYADLRIMPTGVRGSSSPGV